MSYDSLFCEKCQSRLARNVVNNNLLFVCPKCKTTRPTSDSDTLVYTETKSERSGISADSPILSNIFTDRTNLRVSGKCVDPKCDGDVVVQIRDGSDMMKLISGCPKCEKLWY